MFTIRRAGPDDGDVLGEIQAAAREAAYAPFFDPGFAADGVRSGRTRRHERVAEVDTPILPAEHDGRPLAPTAFRASATRPGLAEILSCYTHPDGWGSGVAAALMTETLRHLRDDGFTRTHRWTLRDTPRSRRFHTECGFIESGAVRPFDFGDGKPLTQVEYERTC